MITKMNYWHRNFKMRHMEVVEVVMLLERMLLEE
jgi:hypothetical protein